MLQLQEHIIGVHVTSVDEYEGSWRYWCFTSFLSDLAVLLKMSLLNKNHEA